jgi:WhiB family transcriptional regulator, redox-sensing transcriptional regulator
MAGTQGWDRASLYGTREADDAQSAAGAWRKRAACWNAPPWLMFDPKRSAQRRALALCQGCPVRQACLDYALFYDEPFGVWGGMTPGERARLKEEMAVKPVRRHPGQRIAA